MSRNPAAKYASFDEALVLVQDARTFQLSKWPSTAQLNGGQRPLEEWIVLLDNYMTKLKAVYSETPSYLEDGEQPNVDGRKRITKYSAIIANLAMWLVQASEGHARSSE
mgnify:CR=1 FL=1